MRKFILVLFISNAVNYANGQIRYDNGGLHDGSGNGIGEYSIQGNSFASVRGTRNENQIKKCVLS
jgi:hypothetical protein